MYCAYTIPGMTGSSLMYYYNGKAVRSTPSSIFYHHHPLFLFVLLREGLGEREREGGEKRRERERQWECVREREGRCEGAFFLRTKLKQRGSPPRVKAREDCDSVGVYFWKSCCLSEGIKVCVCVCVCGCESDSSYC